jgi:TetR/AcrR family transcriptional repressor of lmrAB and yxaGH operons
MSSARDRILACTVGLLRSRGVEATGVAEIVAESGAARRSMYNHFPGGKMELMIEATKLAGAAMNGVIEQLTAADDPLQSLDAFVDSWKSMLEGDDFHSGCPIAMATLGSFGTPELAAEAASAFSRWHGTLADQLLRVGLTAPRAESLASFVVSAIEGAVIQCIAYRSTQPLDVCRVHLTTVLVAATAAPSPLSR